MKYTRIIVLFLTVLNSVESKVIEKNQISPTIIEIFKKFIPVYTKEEQESFNSLNPYDITNATIILNKLAQKYFLRPGHLSRLQPHELTEYYSKNLFPGKSTQEIESLCATMYDLFSTSGYLQPISPSYKHPQTVLILGSTIMNMWERINFFNELVEKGAMTISESTKIIICVGERPLLDYEIKDLEKLQTQHSSSLQKNIQDEREAGEIIMKIFPFSTKINHQNIYVVATEKKPNTPRATTADTIDAWMNSDHFNQNNILVISNNPYVEYQKETVFLSLISHNLSIEESSLDQMGFGSRLTSSTFTIKDVGIYLDNLARTIYTLTKIHEIITPSNNWALKSLYNFKTNIFYIYKTVKNFLHI